MGDEAFSYSAKLAFLGRLCRDRRLNQSAIAVASVLLERANRDTGQCFPSVATIEKDSGVPKSTVLRALKALEKCGWIESTKRHGAVTHYRLTSANAGTCPDGGTGPGDGASSMTGTGAISNLRRGQTGSDHDTKVVPVSGHEKKVRAKATGETRSRASPMVTFDQWADSKGEDEMLIPGSDPVFEYARGAGIPGDFLKLAWEGFCRRYRDNPKKYRDWRRVFRNSVENNWFRYWWFNPSAEAYELTTVGIQLDQSIRARGDRAAA